MDEEIEKRIHWLTHAAETKDTTRMWRLTMAAVESAFATHLDLHKKEANAMTGRDEVRHPQQT